MSSNKSWKLLKRKKVYGSKFVNIYQDTVELPNGSILADYTIVEKPSIVMVVATDARDNILTLHEYKYAVGKTLRTLPAGHKKKNETPIDTAKRELREETGFSGDDFEELGILYEYPSKDIHTIHVVRAKNIMKRNSTEHEATETIRWELIPAEKVKKQIQNKKWSASSALAALTLSGILS